MSCPETRRSAALLSDHITPSTHIILIMLPVTLATRSTYRSQTTRDIITIIMINCIGVAVVAAFKAFGWGFSIPSLLFTLFFPLSFPPPQSDPSNLRYREHCYRERYFAAIRHVPWARALILLKTWRYISRLLTYLLTYYKYTKNAFTYLCCIESPGNVSGLVAANVVLFLLNEI